MQIIFMRNLIKTFSLILTIVFLITLCSCSIFMYDNSRFEGGETLDNELLSKIENDVHNESQSSESQEGESQTSESQIAAGIHSDSPIESNTEGNNDSGSTVYWTSGGTVWHTRRDCSYIKNSQNVLFGTVDEAMSSGKKKLCSSCQKH